MNVGVNVEVIVHVFVMVGDMQFTPNTTGFENSGAIFDAPIPATFVTFCPHTDVDAHHVYVPLWSVTFPRLHVTISGDPPVLPAGFDPA